MAKQEIRVRKLNLNLGKKEILVSKLPMVGVNAGLDFADRALRK